MAVRLTGEGKQSIRGNGWSRRYSKTNTPTRNVRRNSFLRNVFLVVGCEDLFVDGQDVLSLLFLHGFHRMPSCSKNSPLLSHVNTGTEMLPNRSHQDAQWFHRFFFVLFAVSVFVSFLRMHGCQATHFRRDHDENRDITRNTETTNQEENATTRHIIRLDKCHEVRAANDTRNRRESASPRPRNQQSYVSAHLCLWRLGSSVSGVSFARARSRLSIPLGRKGTRPPTHDRLEQFRPRRPRRPRRQ